MEAIQGSEKRKRLFGDSDTQGNWILAIKPIRILDLLIRSYNIARKCSEKWGDSNGNETPGKIGRRADQAYHEGENQSEHYADHAWN